MTAARQPRKAEAAVALRLAGASYDDIAEALGYVDAARVLAAVERVLATTASSQDKIRMRELAARRYEALLYAIWDKATKRDMDTGEFHPEQLAAVRTAREIIERHVALQGLAVPVVQVIRTPTTSELEAWVAEVSQVGVPDVDEKDILELEPVTVQTQPDNLA